MNCSQESLSKGNNLVDFIDFALTEMTKGWLPTPTVNFNSKNKSPKAARDINILYRLNVFCLLHRYLCNFCYLSKKGERRLKKNLGLCEPRWIVLLCL